MDIICRLLEEGVKHRKARTDKSNISRASLYENNKFEENYREEEEKNNFLISYKSPQG